MGVQDGSIHMDEPMVRVVSGEGHWGQGGPEGGQEVNLVQAGGDDSCASADRPGEALGEGIWASGVSGMAQVEHRLQTTDKVCGKEVRPQPEPRKGGQPE